MPSLRRADFGKARAPRDSAPPVSARRSGGWRPSSAFAFSTEPPAPLLPPRRAVACWERLGPALTEIEAALDLVHDLRDRPAGTLKLNVPVAAARMVLPAIVPAFLAAYPEIRVEIVAEEGFVDIVRPPAATPAFAMTSGWSRT